MSTYYVEKTLKENGEQSVVLVDEQYRIVEEVALYLHYLEQRGRSKHTIESYCRNLKEFYNWLSKENLKFYEVNKRLMISWIDYLNREVGNKQEKSASTVNKYLATIASFYRYYEGIGGYIEENPVTITDDNNKNSFFIRQVSRKKVDVNFFRQKESKKKNTRRLFPNQIEELYKGIESLSQNEDVIKRNKLIFRILYETGCRIGEVLGLRLMDYSDPSPIEEIGTIYVRKHVPLYHKDHSVKTNERDIPVSMDLIYAIDDYVCTSRPQQNKIDTIFVNHSTNIGSFMIRSSVEILFNELSKAVDIKCTPHMLRHTHGTELKESGYSQIYIMDRLGHNSLESTNKYMHISYEAQLKAYENFIKSRKGILDN